MSYEKKKKERQTLVGGEMAIIKSLAMVGNTDEMSIIKIPTVRPSLLLSTNKILIQPTELLR